MDKIINKALENLEGADYAKFFEEIDKVIDKMPSHMKTLYNEHRGRFMANKEDWNFAQQLELFVKTLKKMIHDNQHDVINESNFSILIGRASQEKELPEDLKEEIITDKETWTESLKQALLNVGGIAVSNRNLEVFEHYGWLIETFLLKMMTESGKENKLTRLAYMAEAYQSSLRYLCYIQVSQILHLEPIPQNESITKFLSMSDSEYLNFDYVNLLITSTQVLEEKNGNPFMDEIMDLVESLTDPEEDLFSTNLFLESHREALLKEQIMEDENLEHLLDEYLTALVYWLQGLAFLAKYKLISIKDIHLNYRAGSDKKFEHLYGELHGVYTSAALTEDYLTLSQIDKFTFNHSILLQKGESKTEQFDNYISLSPLLIDQSVFTEANKQTPEIYYFVAKKGKSKYQFAHSTNELQIVGKENKAKASNKMLAVKNINHKQPKLNELFHQMDNLFQPLISN